MGKYKPYIKKFWYCFLFGPIFMVLEACGEIFLPYLSANIINQGAVKGDIPSILLNGLFLLLLAAAMMVFGVLGANFAVRGAARLAAGIRGDTFRKIQKFSFSNIDTFTTGSLITRITNDITQIQNFTQTLLRGTFRSPIMLIGAIVMSFLLNPRIALILLIMVLVIGAFIGVIIFCSTPRYRTMQKQIDALNVDIRETIINQRVIKAFVRQDYEQKKFRTVNDSLMKKSTAALKLMLWMEPVCTVVLNMTTVIVVWIAGKQIMVGSMEIGTLTAFITYLSQVLNALTFLANIVLQGTRAVVSDRRVSDVLNATVTLNDDHVVEKERQVKNGSITFQNVSFRYFKNNQEEILHNINLQMNAGELVGIIGSTGCGKTTLVSLIPRLYDVEQGAVFVDGVDVKDWSLYHLRESVAMVLQKNTLFTGTIAENLRWGNETATDAELIEAAKIAQADSFLSSFPDGYETELVQGGANLSGGQKQRLCIARALLKKPKILILDDSTSAVDTATDAAIRRAFREKLPGVTKLIIAQRINSVMDADKIIVMEHGCIVGCGIHEELMETCPAYQEIYWSQNDRKEAQK